MARIREQVGKVFLGQEQVLEQILGAFLAGGHVLLEGNPGLGKTHLVLSLARTFGGEFRRIQFTPDLMPSDVTGHTLYDMAAQQFRVRRGPVFCNLLLADEINRAPAKTQAALLEVMQERQITIDGETFALEPPFMTLATQNPIEQEGTYPLPEAQLDRFLMKILIGYPRPEIEEAIVTRVTGSGGESVDPLQEIEKVCSPEEINQARANLALVKIVPEVVAYAVAIVRATREANGISLGAGPRGAISLVSIAKANALLAGRGYVIPDDIKMATRPVLRHRLALAPEVAISGQTLDESIDAVVETIPAPRS
ncbi:MAG: MoxR family ATPase [Verrucomicrobiota bacterium]